MWGRSAAASVGAGSAGAVVSADEIRARINGGGSVSREESEVLGWRWWHVNDDGHVDKVNYRVSLDSVGAAVFGNTLESTLERIRLWEYRRLSLKVPTPLSAA